ncbi:MAG: hypothetical protein NTW29_22875 [Bacteroidetes bacterium]|nr:hypothetical protein [Bacteroidota bacterium]
MKFSKEDFWPKTGKLKKGLIILAIVVLGALGIVLVEEQNDVKLSKRVPMIIAFACLAVWFYNPVKKERT